MKAEAAIQFVKYHYKCEVLHERMLKLWLFFDNKSFAAADRQMVFFEVTDYFAVFRSPFAEAPYVAPIDALKMARRYVAGIELQDDTYLVVHLAPMTSLRKNGIREGLKVVAYMANTLRKDLPAREDFEAT